MLPTTTATIPSQLSSKFLFQKCKTQKASDQFTAPNTAKSIKCNPYQKVTRITT